MSEKQKTACAYYRTSSATNVTKENAKPEEQKDSLHRQKEAVAQYAAQNNITIVKEYYDAAVSGIDQLSERPQFSEMLEYMLGNGARIILIENASRFARDLAVQITGHNLLKSHGIELIPVDCPTHFLEDTPTAEMVRQILGAVAQFEKSSLVLKMRKGRERQRKLTGRCEGRKQPHPDHITMAKHLAKTDLSLRAIADAMAESGFVQYKSEKPYNPGSIKLMINGHYDKKSKENFI